MPHPTAYMTTSASSSAICSSACINNSCSCNCRGAAATTGVTGLASTTLVPIGTGGRAGAIGTDGADGTIGGADGPPLCHPLVPPVCHAIKGAMVGTRNGAMIGRAGTGGGPQRSGIVPYALREYALLYELSTAARLSPLIMPSDGLTLGMPIAGLGAVSGLGSSGCLGPSAGLSGGGARGARGVAVGVAVGGAAGGIADVPGQKIYLGCSAEKWTSWSEGSYRLLCEAATTTWQRSHHEERV
eukprot:scaffold18990_cov69-Phaeocystis_antarctica.AAC.4